jgi:hypothetical protein
MSSLFFVCPFTLSNSNQNTPYDVCNTHVLSSQIKKCNVILIIISKKKAVPKPDPFKEKITCSPLPKFKSSGWLRLRRSNEQSKKSQVSYVRRTCAVDFSSTEKKNT